MSITTASSATRSGAAERVDREDRMAVLEDLEAVGGAGAGSHLGLARTVRARHLNKDRQTLRESWKAMALAAEQPEAEGSAEEPATEDEPQEEIEEPSADADSAEQEEEQQDG